MTRVVGPLFDIDVPEAAHHHMGEIAFAGGHAWVTSLSATQQPCPPTLQP